MSKHSGGHQERRHLGGNMHEGMSRKCPPGDSGERPPRGLTSDDPVRDSVAKSHSLGPREA
jgi:hypothetical protein